VLLAEIGVIVTLFVEAGVWDVGKNVFEVLETLCSETLCSVVDRCPSPMPFVGLIGNFDILTVTGLGRSAVDLVPIELTLFEVRLVLLLLINKRVCPGMLFDALSLGKDLEPTCFKVV
jgi:hypothetical protein